MSRSTLYRALGLSVAFTLVATQAHAQTTQAPRKRYALIVTHNESVEPNVKPLRYADDDGARYYELFSQMADETRLLTVLDDDSQKIFKGLAARTRPPTRAQLKLEVKRLAARIAADRKRGVASDVYLVFGGHGHVDKRGEGYLSLVDGKLKRSELFREVVQPLGADYTHLIIDACHAYFMVQSRGGDGDWQDDRSGRTLDRELQAYLTQRSRGGNTKPVSPTIGVVLSTSGAAEVHEWSAYRGGVFSHELRSGLLGAADANGDRRITYVELEAYLAAANAQVTNPRAKISVFARAPAQDRQRALIDLSAFRAASELELPDGGGHYHVEDGRGLRYADVHLSKGHQARLMLLRGPVGAKGHYYLRDGSSEAKLSVAKPTIARKGLTFVAMSDQARSSVESSFRDNLFATPYGPGFVAGFRTARSQGVSSPVLPAESASAWQLQTTLVYALGTPWLDGAGGLQHQAVLSTIFRHGNGVGIGPYLSYGFSAHQGRGADSFSSWELNTGGALHRISLGAELNYLFELGPVNLAPRLRLGHQTTFLSTDDAQGDSVAADLIGLRAEVGGALELPLSAGFATTLDLGLAADVFTRTGAVSGDEVVTLNPFLGLGLRF